MPTAVESSVLERRRAGVLLHITSLPGQGSTGDLGEHAHRFVEFLAGNSFSVWQTLPVGPTHEDGSPYQCLSAHAGNPLLINLQWLVEQGWLDPEKTCIKALSVAAREECLKQAFQAFNEAKDSEQQEAYQKFIRFHHYWLEDFALFMALKASFKNQAWWDWPESYRDRNPAAIEEVCRQLADEVRRIQFEQFVFFQQWKELRHYAHQHGVLLFGDMPIFVAADSADVWARREYFLLDEEGHPTVVAGVPPDYFSETGQRWGNPHYNWRKMQEDGFAWWIERMHTQLELFDWIRIDHFRGFEAYWEIPANSMTAIKGRWVEAPGEALLEAIYEKFGALPLVAENLGIITPEVEAMRKKFGIPGMLILQFAFEGGTENPYLPHNHTQDNVVYTGTHDNDTTLSWFELLNAHQQDYVVDYLAHPQVSMPYSLVLSAMQSVAKLAVIPMQDILGLGQGHRMNTPGTIEGNWQWRFSWDQVSQADVGQIKHWVELYGRG
ncbi:MAG: 4-alpha-glucanotransferase [Methylothermaceae bacteria B42]|nr:MAG: 4-alpha-glucanotransferase [Methylothermaceae bacteria B42]HHJ39679.1 4-alpha-glucanotransferase [Methylothermaceae bacterium]